ncbi:MAG: orotate phosphoribosyltransferase [Patescibacteria group bacterium]|jgi:orotate phosphoribosyltransferase
MEQYKKDFITFLAESNALQFGEFTLKSGRLSPYFINTGLFDTGEQIATLGEYYADAIKNAYGDNFDVLYGPAYKGIPLCVTAAAALARRHGINKNFTFNRKEIKDHGDKKLMVGHAPQAGERVLIIDDVITDGGALVESMEILQSTAGLKYAGVILSVNRQEKTKQGKNAVEEFTNKYQMPINFIITIRDIIEFLNNREINGRVYLNDDLKNKMENYLKQYGI